MLETGGINFNDQITKTFFNNAFNNEMHKTLIGFFIPAIYIAYYTMFHGMNNKLETLRTKDETTTTVIKITGNSTTVDSITNDEMDWEPTVTNSSTKMVGRKTKWDSPAIITEKKKKTCFRCGNVGHRVNKRFFFFARRPVVATVITATVIPPTTTTTIP